MKKVTYADLNEINNLRTITLVKNSVFEVTARLDDEDNILVEFITLDDLETKKAKILETENLSFSEIVQILNGERFWQTFDDYITLTTLQRRWELFENSLRTLFKGIEEEEKGGSYLFSYDTLRAVFKNEKQNGDKLCINQYCISIYHDGLWKDSVTIDCKNFDWNYWTSDIDKDYDIKLKDITFLEFVDRVKAIEEEILEDIGNLRDYHNEKGQELADTYNEIKKIMERD